MRPGLKWLPFLNRDQGKAFRPVPLRMLAGLIIVSLTLAYYLLPSSRKLLERQLEDGQLPQALSTLRDIPLSERETDPAFFDLLELQLVRQLLDPTEPRMVIRQLLEAAHGYEAHGFRDAFLVEILTMIRKAPNIEQAHTLLRPAITRMPQRGQQRIYLYLANAALSADQPVLAPQLYVQFWQSSPRAEETTHEMAKLWRSAGHAQKALDTIETYLADTGVLPVKLTFPLARLRIDLFRETAQPGLAFEALRELFPTVTPDHQAEVFDLLISTALESSRTPEVLPIVQARAEKSPEDAALWKRLGELAVSGGDIPAAIQAYQRLTRLQPASAENWGKIGQLSEWNTQPNQAFDAYLKALELRDTAGIERLADLSQGLYRDAELALKLEELGDLIDPSRFPRQFARLYGRVGDFDKARKLYTDLLKAPDASAELLIEYGSFLQALSEFEPAYEAFRRASLLKPGDQGILKALAEIQFRLGDYSRSLLDYQALLKSSDEIEVFETYLRLAESLGNLEGIIQGLRIKIAGEVEVSDYDYERLALFLNIQGKRTEYLQTLEQALERFPDRKNLRETTAYAYSDGGQLKEALRHLEQHPDLRTHPRLVRFYVSVLAQMREFEKALAFFNSVPAKRVASAPLMELRAYVNEAAGNIDEATRVYSQLYEAEPRNARYALNYGRLLSSIGKARQAETLIAPFLKDATPETSRLAAQVYSALGDFQEAEQLQFRFLKSGPQAAEAPQAWGFLGDLRLVQGDRRGAKRAYQTGLNEMFKDFAPGNRSLSAR
ncbi:MAG: tetratricopeptide repeat protein [Verrucomicrobia bacterium]|nr:tetratricopeptide repeat protein [Verrucomicrobiota bacterium]